MRGQPSIVSAVPAPVGFESDSGGDLSDRQMLARDLEAHADPVVCGWILVDVTHDVIVPSFVACRIM
jgi:hypothetical protein